MSRPARRFGGVYVAGSEDPYNRNPGEGQKILFCQDSKFTFHFFAAEDQQSYCYAGKYTENNGQLELTVTNPPIDRDHHPLRQLGAQAGAEERATVYSIVWRVCMLFSDQVS